MLISLRDRRVREKIVEQVRLLEVEPEKQGKPLIGELSGYRSLRAVGQRYKIIFRIEKEKTMVWIMALGIRKEGSKRDIYTLARKLISLYFKK
ncbi:MAG: type II toxin-antitoxin system RelE/ParE family toxin [Deltaproteobacteria bacterium]|nr:type II toxin-antitoxin system RelE/ParE family toxin [Deltaproteobacteria bacterium]